VTWTFTEAVDTSDRDWVRFAIGDIDSSDPQISDELIASLISEHGTKEGAAIAAAQGLAAKYARKATKSVGDLNVSYKELQENYTAMASRLRRELSLRSPPLAGGISKDRKDTVNADTDRVEPWARRDQFRHVGNEDEFEDDPTL